MECIGVLPNTLFTYQKGPGKRVKVKVFHGMKTPSVESTTTECGVNYQLLAVMY